MRLRTFSASKSTLATICGYSFRLDVQTPIEVTSEYAELGNEIHGAIDATIDGRPVPELGKVAKRYYDAWVRQWWETHKGMGWRSERAYAVAPRLREAIALEVKNRKYPDLGADWICGTADALYLGTDAAHIVDWKTGAHAPSAYRNGQLYTLALAVSLVHRVDVVQVSIVQVSPKGLVASTHVLDRDELAEWRETLVDTLDRIPTSEPVPGPHCAAHWCALRHECPSLQKTKEIGAFDVEAEFA